ncbi:meiotic cell cortex C-terminal pleckstrin homology-domain-containing protein [Phycomyces nitens]|nr:meiotic cell cortex C-terminal pleckstrin homology-domain-containing protein [Phycomyces nitens]
MLPHHSFSSPLSPNPPALLPSDSLSPTASTDTLKRQLTERQRQLETSSNGIGRNVLVRQINQLQERIRDETNDPSKTDELPPLTREKLKSLERDLTAYRAFPSTSQTLRKEKRTGLDPIPSPSTSLSPHDIILPPPPTGSTPTKRRSKIPNKDRRNTDIEFATEIGQGLLLEVRKMQSLLQEKEEQLRALEIQKADLERSTDLTTKQLRLREETEEKLKEEIWNLELAQQEITLTVTDLQQHLNRATTDQQRALQQVDALQTELEQAQDREERQNVTIDGMKIRHEQDLTSVRRHAANLARDNTEQQKQIENLTREMAILRAQATIGTTSQPNSTPSPSPAPSLSVLECPPTPEPSSPPPMIRRQSIEAETLKTTLGHAHRMVSNLRSNLHREKTEKFELKKLLAESQETIEQLQNDPRLWVDAQVRSHDRKRKPSVPASTNRRRHVRRVRGSTGRSLKEDEGLELYTENPLVRFSEESDSDFDPESLTTPNQSASPVALSMADELNRASQRNSSEIYAGISLGVQTDPIPEPAVSAPMPAIVAKTDAGVQTDTIEPIAIPSSSSTSQTELVVPIESSTQTSKLAPIESSTQTPKATPVESLTQTPNIVVSGETISTQTDLLVAAESISTQTDPHVPLHTLDPLVTATAAGLSQHTLSHQAISTDSLSPIEKSQEEVPEIRAISPDDLGFSPDQFDLYGLDSVGSFGTVTIAPPRPTCSPPASLLIKAHGMLSSASDIQSLDLDTRRQSVSASSVSTTASELPSGSPVDDPHLPHDPMITLITQTMIGDWLWKYTRKTVGGGLSEHRHKRYFWIHPYTRTLYWSIHAPGRDDESRTRSASIEQVSVISDPTINPPGLPNVSILIQTSTRKIKLTAPSMAVHTVWVESLCHLLNRADSEKTDYSQHETEHFHPKNHSEEIESDLDDGLEDVRMCCDGKHHVSKLEKVRADRSTYRQRKSRTALRQG